MTEKNLFRQKALTAVEEGSESGHAAQVIAPVSWLAMFALLVGVIAIVLWLFYGTIPVRIHGEGILLPKQGSFNRAVAPEGSGRIEALKVQVGDTVEEGEIVAALRSDELAQHLNAEQTLLTALELEFRQLSAQSKSELESRLKEVAQQEKTLNNILQAETKNLKQIQDLLDRKQGLLSKGIATRQDVALTSRDFYLTKREIQNTLTALSDLKTRLQDFRQQWDDRLRNLELKIREARRTVSHLRDQYQFSLLVRSPADGTVTHIHVSAGQKVAGGDPVLLIASGLEQVEALVYLPAAEGKKVKPGMTAQISPSIFKKQEYGSILGTVLSVSAYPMTRDAIQAVLQNERLTEQFLQAGPLLQVRVKLLEAKQNVSGYEWTTSQGPAQTVSPGTLLEAMIQVERKKPIELMLPALKKLVSES